MLILATPTVRYSTILLTPKFLPAYHPLISWNQLVSSILVARFLVLPDIHNNNVQLGVSGLHPPWTHATLQYCSLPWRKMTHEYGRCTAAYPRGSNMLGTNARLRLELMLSGPANWLRSLACRHAASHQYGNPRSALRFSLSSRHHKSLTRPWFSSSLVGG